ncbi:MAG: ROK family protein [Christensenellaceae bacterium]
MFIMGQNNQCIELSNQQQLRRAHLRQVFDLVLENKHTSRTWMANRLKLSTTAVSSLVDELLENDILVSKGLGKSKTAGRKPLIVEINNNWQQIATFKLNVNEINFVLFDMTCTPIEVIKKKFSGNDYINYIKDILNSSERINHEKISAICLSVPAIADPNSQRLLLNVLDIEDDKAFLQEVSNIYPDAVLLVGNDSANYAYAEKEYSHSKDVDNLIYINYGYGIGAGIIINSEIFNGAGGCPGEIGHMSIDMNGPQCMCGNKGCLERLINIPAVLREVRTKIGQGGFSQITRLCKHDLNAIDIEIVAAAYKNKDLLACDVMNDIAEKLSIGIRNIISIFNPQVIVLGGEAHHFGEDFLKTVIKETLSRGAWKSIADVEIRYTNISENGSNVGIAKYFLDNVVSFENKDYYMKERKSL